MLLRINLVFIKIKFFELDIGINAVEHGKTVCVIYDIGCVFDSETAFCPHLFCDN